MRSESKSTPYNAYTAEYLTTAGPEACVALERAGTELLAQAREAMSVHAWPSPLEEGRQTLQSAAAELRQMATWLENPDYAEQLSGNQDGEAASLFEVGSGAGGPLRGIAHCLEVALEGGVPPAGLRDDGPAIPRPGAGPAHRLLLWEVAQELQAASRHLTLAAEGAGDGDIESLRLVDLERTIHEHFLPTAHHLTLEGAHPGPGARLEPEEALQRLLATLAECLRLWVPTIRRLASEAKAALPPTDEHQEGDQEGDLPFPASLWARVDGLIADSLCGAIVDLEAMAGLSPEEPERLPRKAHDLWAELDPEAPGGKRR